MIKRTVEISSGPTYLSMKNDQLVVSREREVVGTIPSEDIGLVIVDHPAVTYTHSVLTTLMEHGAVVIACGRDHHPSGYVWPVQANTLHTERLRLQVECSRPLGKRIWQQIVRAKIVAQARNLILTPPLPAGEGQGEGMPSEPRPSGSGPPEPRPSARATPPHPPAYKKLKNLAEEVRSGDPSNVEAHAAKVYWKALFPASPLTKGGLQGGFHRDPDGPPPNNLLNYGYMALRAAVARAICGAGLHPSIGFHHRNRYNAFCLADDLMEPLRPFVDARVKALVSRGRLEIDKDTKTELLGVLTEAVTVGGESGPLLVALSKMMTSLVRVMEGGEKRLEIPSACT